MEKTLIFGHQKPDTDSVTSAIVLSYLKNKLGWNTEPRVLGSINNETKFVLNYFNFKTPKFLNDVRLQIKDIDYNKNCFFHEKESIYKAYNYMKRTKISTIPVVDFDNNYLGAVSMKYITGDLIDGDFGVLNTSYDNLIDSLNGEVILKFDDEITGNIIVPSYNSEVFKNVLATNDIIIVGDRYKILNHAVESDASLIILTDDITKTEEFMSNYITFIL